MHAEEFQCDVSLIVIHGNDRVVVAVTGADHERIGGERALQVESFSPATFDCRPDDCLLLVSEQPALAAVRIRLAQTAIRGGEPLTRNMNRWASQALASTASSLSWANTLRSAVWSVTWTTAKPAEPRTSGDGPR